MHARRPSRRNTGRKATLCELNCMNSRNPMQRARGPGSVGRRSPKLTRGASFRIRYPSSSIQYKQERILSSYPYQYYTPNLLSHKLKANSSPFQYHSTSTRINRIRFKSPSSSSSRPANLSSSTQTYRIPRRIIYSSINATSLCVSCGAGAT